MRRTQVSIAESRGATPAEAVAQGRRGRRAAVLDRAITDPSRPSWPVSPRWRVHWPASGGDIAPKAADTPSEVLSRRGCAVRRSRSGRPAPCCGCSGRPGSASTRWAEPDRAAADEALTAILASLPAVGERAR